MRSPEPVTIRTRAFPPIQPGRSTISWSTAARFGVCCSAVRAPTVGHVGGAHVTVAVVLGRVEMLRAVVVNEPALSAAAPETVRLTVAVDVSSTWNWIQAAVTVAPRGSAHPGEPETYRLRVGSVLSEVEVTAGQGHGTRRRAFLGVVGAGPHGDVEHRRARIGGGDRHVVGGLQLAVVPGQPQHIAPGGPEGRRRRRGTGVRRTSRCPGRSPSSTPRSPAPADSAARRRSPTRPATPRPAASPSDPGPRPPRAPRCPGRRRRR